MRLPKSEPALVKLAAQCDDEAFNALVDRQRPLLRMIARRFGESPEEREDLSQDVIARLLEADKRALRDWEPLAPFAAYLTTIASRLGIRFRQQQDRLLRRQPRSLPAAQDDLWDDVLEETAVAPSHDGPDAHIESAERMDIIRGATQQLSDRDQLIIRLRFFEDLDGPGLAEILGLSPGAARKAVFDALRRLERILDAEREELFPEF